MKNKGLFMALWCLFLYSFPAYGLTWKPDTVTLNEMIEHFQAWKCGQYTIPVFDTLVAETVAPSNAALLLRADGRQPQSIVSRSLPPAVWTIAADNRAGNRQLFFKHVLSNADAAKKETALMQQRVGGKPGDAASDGTPARKVSGRLHAVYDARMAGGFVLCREINVYQVLKGVVTDTMTLRCSPGRLSQEQVSWFSPTYSRSPYDRWYGSLELSLLTYSLCSLTEPCADYEGNCDFTMLVHVDAAGRSTLHPLLPENLSEKEKFVVDGLKRAFEALPAGYFGTLLTADGRVFPGRYLRAFYKPRLNRWYFADALSGQQEGSWHTGTPWERPYFGDTNS